MMLNLNSINALIETFEEFLDERNIEVPNEDKEQSENPSTIYGMDYSELQYLLIATLENMGIEVADEWDDPRPSPPIADTLS